MPSPANGIPVNQLEPHPDWCLTPLHQHLRAWLAQKGSLKVKCKPSGSGAVGTPSSNTREDSQTHVSFPVSPCHQNVSGLDISPKSVTDVTPSQIDISTPLNLLRSQ